LLKDPVQLVKYSLVSSNSRDRYHPSQRRKLGENFNIVNLITSFESLTRECPNPLKKERVLENGNTARVLKTLRVVRFERSLTGLFLRFFLKISDALESAHPREHDGVLMKLSELLFSGRHLQTRIALVLGVPGAVEEKRVARLL